MLDHYKKKVFDIPQDTPCRFPIINPISEEDIAYWTQRYNFDKERTIIFSSYIYQQNEHEVNFWDDLAQKLIEKNYIVYTHLEQFSDKVIPGTKPILANCDEIYYIAKNVKCFISSRTGLLNFLAMTTDVNTFFVNEFPFWVWDIKKIFPNSHSHTFYNAFNLIKPINDEIKNVNVTMDLELSHPKINSEDIFYSYEDMLKPVLEAVEKI